MCNVSATTEKSLGVIINYSLMNCISDNAVCLGLGMCALGDKMCGKRDSCTLLLGDLIGRIQCALPMKHLEQISRNTQTRFHMDVCTVSNNLLVN